MSPATLLGLTRVCVAAVALLVAPGNAPAFESRDVHGSDSDTGMVVSSERSTQAKAAAPQQHSSAEIHRLIHRAAQRHGVEAALVHAVIAAESAYDARAVSPAGAIGLMQLMPATASDYGVHSRAALFEPSINIDAGVRHLKRLLGKYRGDYGRVIMAYNAGEGVVDRTDSKVRYPETLDYTEAVIRRYRALGGTRPLQHVLRKVSALRKPVGAAITGGGEHQDQGNGVGVLPATSPRLRAGLPKAPLNAMSPLRDRSRRVMQGQDKGQVPAQGHPRRGSGIRAGIDPALNPARRGTPVSPRLGPKP
ncbi:lytic transglycosylase domain-containing protein [uncultured Thiohalocapsa sp.]|uniref:lytic transglycosylase domain-containing protein n=1 Tax=uncultured Thiohalocapsa sp. TaxID=768990 RepID=UPI0025F7ABA1|nr:lytic transglycosylase domain-containing protein [uncultured Thiohalocapsa sp.]